MILAISIVGAAAVIAFVLFLVLGLTRGWQDRGARRLLLVAAALGIVCAVLGATIPLISG